MERREGLRQLRVVKLADNASHDVTFDESAYGVFPSGNPEFKTATFRFSYSSPVTPSTVYDYNPSTRQRVVMKQQEIPSGFDKTNTRCVEPWRLHATASRCPSRSSCREARRSTAAVRCCSTRTARMAPPPSPRSVHRSSASSIAG